MPTVTDAALKQVLVEGVERPAGLPRDLFDAAVGTFLDGQRIDMKDLAAQLGISRATLYRRAIGRDHVVGQVVWWLARQAFARQFHAHRRKKGAALVVEATVGFLKELVEQPAMQRFIDQEPEAAARLLISANGPVQPGMIEAVTRLLRREEERGELEPIVDVDVLAYLIVRIGESFLYSDLLSAAGPDLRQARKVLRALVPAR